MRIESPNITWDADGTPRSLDHDDIYFNPGRGAAETRHVFIEGNDLPSRFAALQPNEPFVIAELGYGTGLNMQTTLDAFREVGSKGRLIYVGIDGRPVPSSKLQVTWKHLNLPRIPGGQSIGDFILLHGMMPVALDEMVGAADAWFLDGFSPAKNPAMWTETVLQAVFDRTRPGGTVATFTAAGAVRRGLAAAGFAVQKVPGFGSKRDMVTAQRELKDASSATTATPASPSRLTQHRVAVIGGGLAGTQAARALRAAGHAVTIFDPSPGEGGSGNPQAVLEPLMNLEDTPRRRWFTAAYVRAVAYLSQRSDECGGAASQAPFVPQGIGSVVRLADPQRDHATLDRAVASMGWQDGGLVRDGRGVRSWGSCCVDPRELVRAIVHETDDGQATRRSAVTGLERCGDGWRVVSEDGGRDASDRMEDVYDVVVLACADAVRRFDPCQDWSLQRVRGQISWVKATQASAELQEVLVGHGWICPAVDGRHVVGATHHREDGEPSIRPADHDANRAMAEATAPDWSARMNWDDVQGRVAWRCATPDRLPMIGPVPDAEACRRAWRGRSSGALATPPDWLTSGSSLPCVPGLYAITGLGSRGVMSSILGGDLLAAMIDGTPLPCDRTAAEAVHPGRFLVRAARRGEPIAMSRPTGHTRG